MSGIEIAFYASIPLVFGMLKSKVVSFGIALALGSGLQACGSDDKTSDENNLRENPLWEADVTLLKEHDVADYNDELDDGLPTANIVFYMTEGGPIQWETLHESIERAQRVFIEAGVQLRVQAAVDVSIPAEWQTLDTGTVLEPITPEYRESNLYAHLDEIKPGFTERSTNIFEAIISKSPKDSLGISDAHTIHVISLQNVPIGFFEYTNDTWIRSSVPTGGLSMPPYYLADRVPKPIRGVITMSQFGSTRTLAHELGHKLINVSHEGKGVCPSFEADGSDLMLYGNGHTIGKGAEGRWHHERLQLSPFLFKRAGEKLDFEHTFKNGGIYGDPLYGEFIVDPPCP